MSDIVKRLRQAARTLWTLPEGYHCFGDLDNDAATEIDRLTRENAQLREALITVEGS